MIIDHVGAVFFPRESAFRIVGRIAFPLYAWCVVLGAVYTHDVKKYALRLFITGIFSQPFFMAALKHSWNELNIFFTLLLGLLGITGIRLKKSGSHIWCPILAVLAACIVYVDYSWQGVLFILLLYSARKSRAVLTSVMIAFCLFWGTSGGSMAYFFGIPVPVHIPWLPQAASLLGVLRRIQFWALLALPLMLFPIQVSVKFPRWMAYAAYPLHLFLIFLVQRFV